MVPASGEVVAALSGTVTPQGMVGVCALPRTTVTDVLAAAPRLVAVLAHVRDPGNAGTVIRAADAAGAGGVVLTDASVDPYNPKTVRATAGSLWHLPVATGAPLGSVVEQVRAAGLRVLAADGAGDRDLDDLVDDGSLAAPTVWIFGNEAWGLPEADRALADEVVRVPIHGRAESPEPRDRRRGLPLRQRPRPPLTGPLDDLLRRPGRLGSRCPGCLPSGPAPESKDPVVDREKLNCSNEV